MKESVKFACAVGVWGLLALTQQPLLRADLINVYQNTTGAITTADRTATFNSLTTGNAISSYTEGGLNFGVSGASDFVGFSPAPGGFSGGFFYPSGGANAPLIISSSDGATLYGIQFYIGSGFGQTTLPLAYELLRGGTVVGSGTLTAVDSGAGYLLGFGDASGFTSLEIADCSSAPCTVTSYNAIAIDNVTATVTQSSPVPEPGAVMLLGTVLLAIGAGARRKLVAR